MPPFSSVSSALILASCLLQPPQASEWKPLYDYTNMQPSDAEYWAPLEASKVTFKQALELAMESEEGTVRLLSGRVRENKEGQKIWQLELFVGDDPKAPRRVNLQVSMAKPEITKRLTLNTLIKAERFAWAELLQAKVNVLDAVDVAFTAARGRNPVPMIVAPHIHRVNFTPSESISTWDFSVMGIDKKDRLRRYNIAVPGHRPVMRHKLLQDRYAGEPLRKDQPTLLDNGLLVFDFLTGEGAEINADSRIRVNYRLFLLDGTLVHDTWDSKRAEVFKLSEAPIKGITEGLMGLRVGTKRKIVMPHEMAFGDQGTARIPPRATITCDIIIEDLMGQ
jgi:hypothetical protein